MDFDELFSVKGRLRRKDYLLRTLILALPVSVIHQMTVMSGEQNAIIFTFLLVILCSVILTLQYIKRLHDINFSGWYWLIGLIPLANIFFGLYVIFKDGTPGPNRFGEDPKGRPAKTSQEAELVTDKQPDNSTKNQLNNIDSNRNKKTKTLQIEINGSLIPFEFDMKQDDSLLYTRETLTMEEATGIVDKLNERYPKLDFEAADISKQNDPFAPLKMGIVGKVKK